MDAPPPRPSRTPSRGRKDLCEAQHLCDVSAPRPVSHVVTHPDIGQYRDTHSRIRLSTGSTWYGRDSTYLTIRAKRFAEQITGLLEPLQHFCSFSQAFLQEKIREQVFHYYILVLLADVGLVWSWYKRPSEQEKPLCHSLYPILEVATHARFHGRMDDAVFVLADLLR